AGSVSHTAAALYRRQGAYLIGWITNTSPASERCRTRSYGLAPQQTAIVIAEDDANHLYRIRFIAPSVGGIPEFDLAAKVQPQQTVVLNPCGHWDPGHGDVLTFRDHATGCETSLAKVAQRVGTALMIVSDGRADRLFGMSKRTAAPL